MVSAMPHRRWASGGSTLVGVPSSSSHRSTPALEAHLPLLLVKFVVFLFDAPHGRGLRQPGRARGAGGGYCLRIPVL